MRVKTERMEQAERMNVRGGVAMVMAWDKGVAEDCGITGWDRPGMPGGGKAKAKAIGMGMGMGM